jgi:hypothetical protein
MAAAAIAMRAAYLRCGLNAETADYIMEDQGIDSTEELLMSSKDSFDSMIKNANRANLENIAFSSASARRLQAFKFWAEEQYMCVMDTNPALFTAPVSGSYLRIMRADEIEEAAKKGQTPTIPDPIKSEKDWFKFWEEFKNYLGRVRGAAKVPILYVVRDHREVTDEIRDSAYTSHSRKVSALLRLSGEHFDVDNVSVWEILKGLTIDGFAWSFVKRFDNTMDGRGAIEALRRQCEGKTSVKTRKNKAYASIAGAVYRGIRKNFTFAQYVAIHQTGHNKLAACNEPIPEIKKVSDFFAGINDSSLEARITCVLSDDRYSDSFESTQQFLGTLVANQMIHRQGRKGTSDDSNVSSTEGGGNRSIKGGKATKKKRVAACFYSNKAWNSLTADKKAQVIELKKAAKKRKPKEAAGSKRKALATESDRHEPESDEEVDAEDAAPTAQGGNEFGRGAHKKKKTTVSAMASSRANGTDTAESTKDATKTWRYVMATAVLRRFVMDSNVTDHQDTTNRVELDTHADTCVAGSNTVVLDLTGKLVSVSPFCEAEYNSIENVPIATVATAYDCPATGRVYVLVINEALYIGDKMHHTLLCPNQLRVHGLKVDDCPKQYDKSSTHSIMVPDNNLTMPLSMRGVISGLTTRRPTEGEVDDVSLHVELTSDVDWDPYALSFSGDEELHDDTWKERTSLASVSTTTQPTPTHCPCCSDLLDFGAIDPTHYYDRLVASVRCDHSTTASLRRDASAVVRTGISSEISPEMVAKRWHVGLSAATRTLQVTTQLGVRTLKHPAQRRFRTAMPHLRYPRLKGTYYADTLFFSTKSARGFKCAHLIGNGLGFTRFTPMELKADAYLSLTNFIKEDGIMENLVVDNDPTMAYKQWKQTVREFWINQTMTEPCSPWQNKAELNVRETKRAIRRFKRKSGSPRRLWCFLGEHVSTLRGLTAFDVPKLMGRCAAEHALGYTPDISPWIMHSWYDNVWYRDHDGKNKIGKWLGLEERLAGVTVFGFYPCSQGR